MLLQILASYPIWEKWIGSLNEIFGTHFF
jgi:hypothetical protein